MAPQRDHSTRGEPRIRTALRSIYKSSRELGRGVSEAASRRLHDRRHNRRAKEHDQRLLILRHPTKGPQSFDAILRWLAEHHPDILSRIELRLLPILIRDVSPYRLFVPWLQDPVQDWSCTVFQRVHQFEQKFASKGISVVNSVGQLLNATKVEGARRIKAAGLQVPRMDRITSSRRYVEDFYGFDPPFIIREEWGHGKPMTKVETRREALAVDLTRFRRPVIAEFIDVADPQDGICRKYRYVAAGETGISLSLHATDGWLTRGTNALQTPRILDEEVSFVSQMDTNHEVLQQARRSLELDYVAFDYGYDRHGRVIVWEANPFPYLHLPQSAHRAARRSAYVRVFQALIRYYLRCAKLEVPSSIHDPLQSYQSGECAR
jgi:hypothetical protein